MSLVNVEILAGIEDPKLTLIYQMTTDRLITMLDPLFDHVPAGLEYIVEEVTLARFNRIGAEGMSSESVEGHTTTFLEDDFALHRSAIDAYLGRNKKARVYWN